MSERRDEMNLGENHNSSASLRCRTAITQRTFINIIKVHSWWWLKCNILRFSVSVLLDGRFTLDLCRGTVAMSLRSTMLMKLIFRLSHTCTKLFLYPDENEKKNERWSFCLTSWNIKILLRKRWEIFYDASVGKSALFCFFICLNNYNRGEMGKGKVRIFHKNESEPCEVCEIIEGFFIWWVPIKPENDYLVSRWAS